MIKIIPQSKTAVELSRESSLQLLEPTNDQERIYSTNEYLFKLEQDQDTSDLYQNGKKLRILKSLI